MKELSGVSLFASIKINDRIFNDNLLFSHKGLSGPCILNASLFWQKGHISLDFLPQNNIKSYLNKNKNKQISSLLPLPKRFIKEYLKKINLEDKVVKNLTKNEIKLLDNIHNYIFSPAGTFGYNKAEVTKGGVKVDEICKFTYESKKVKNLYFIGEVLDITGRLGGYNFYFAFASSMMLAKNFDNF